MQNPILTSAGRCAASGSVIALTLLTASCKLPSREAWAQVQQRGLLPVLFAGDASNPAGRPAQNVAQAPPAQPTTAPLKVQAVQQPQIAAIPFATPVPGRPGYVFSPHTSTRKVVDVREYAAGAEVRCPYSMKDFQVPDFSALADAPPRTNPPPQQSIAEVVSRTVDSPASGSGDLAPLLTPDPAASLTPDATSGDIPYGSRVPDRPGFVYSPFASRNQLVDVAGIAPGVEVKCPYTEKLFRVPEPSPEEVLPILVPDSTIPPAPPAPESGAAIEELRPTTPPPNDASAAPPSPSTQEPSATASLPVPVLPTASWADKEKNQVQSPFGSPGQLIDVSGRASGSTMQCPFTNKEFVIPAP